MQALIRCYFNERRQGAVPAQAWAFACCFYGNPLLWRAYALAPYKNGDWRSYAKAL